MFSPYVDFFLSFPLTLLNGWKSQFPQQEIAKAITSKQSNLHPSSDRLPSKFFLIISIRHHCGALSFQNPVCWKNYLNLSPRLTLIAKKGKDLTNCPSSRPISLYNTKILAKLLTHRLENLLPSTISNDQTGLNRNCHNTTLDGFLILFSLLRTTGWIKCVVWTYLFTGQMYFLAVFYLMDKGVL